MPDVDDFPTDDTLRFGKLRTVFLSFADFGLVLVPFTPKVFLEEKKINYIIKVKIIFFQNIQISNIKNLHMQRKSFKN